MITQTDLTPAIVATMIPTMPYSVRNQTLAHFRTHRASGRQEGATSTHCQGIALHVLRITLQLVAERKGLYA